jgi:hypothetical protein
MVKYKCKKIHFAYGGKIMASSAIGSKKNVKIFVLYLMENINYPLDYATLNDIIMQTDYVMYLDFAESFHEMMDAGLILEVESDDKERPAYVVSQKGKYVARELNSDILTSILDKSLSAALRYLDFKKRGVEAKSTITKLDDGRYEIECMMLEKREVIYSTKVIVDTLQRAERMKENFYSRPEGIYKATLALLAGNVNFLLD